jgi:hypothetical protein
MQGKPTSRSFRHPTHPSIGMPPRQTHLSRASDSGREKQVHETPNVRPAPQRNIPSEQRIWMQFGASWPLTSQIQPRSSVPAMNPGRLCPSAAQCKDDPSIAVLPFWMIPGNGASEAWLQARWLCAKGGCPWKSGWPLAQELRGAKKKARDTPPSQRHSAPRDARARLSWPQCLLHFFPNASISPS